MSIAAIVCWAIGGIVATTLILASPAFAGTVTLRPNGDPPSPVWSPSAGSTNWSIINRANEATTSWICRNSGTVGDLYDLTDAPVYQGVTSVELRVFTALGQQVLVLADDKIGMNLEADGALVGATTYSDPPSPGLGVLQTCSSADFGGYGWRGQTFSGAWSQSTVDGMRFLVARQQTGLIGDALRVAQAEAVVTYTDPPNLAQSAYRVYQNADNLAPGASLGSTNMAADVHTGDNFRMRLGVTVGTEAWSANYGSNKLQFAAKNDTTCAGSSGWSDVMSGSGAIRWHDNASVVDGAAITSHIDDPVTGGTKVYQQYRESNDFTNPVAIPLTNDAIWDFSLNAAEAVPSVSYCFRIANVTGTIPITYSYYPEIIATGDYGVEFVDSSDVGVASPAVLFSGVNVSTRECQQSTGILGSSAERLRVSNDLVTNGWSLSIAATGGPTAQWDSGSMVYDFNDPSGSPSGCTDGSDSDGVAGNLTVQPLSGQFTSQPGCSDTGLSLGSNAQFSQDTTDAITLASASSAASRFCYWDITGILLQQKIPIATPTGSYSIDMTVTITAF